MSLREMVSPGATRFFSTGMASTDWARPLTFMLLAPGADTAA